ncbi:hypothetical protein V6Z12_A07G088700 [Gossypium hirsutum]
MGTSPKGYLELFQPLLEQINWNPSILPYQNIVPSTNPPDRLFHQQFLRCPHIPPGIQMVVGTVEQVGVSDAWASWWPRLRRASVRGTDEAERRALGMLRLGFSAANICFFYLG